MIFTWMRANHIYCIWWTPKNILICTFIRFNKKWLRNGQEMTKRGPRKDQEMTKKWPRKWPRNDQESTKKMTKKWPRNDQEMTKKWPRNDQEMTKKWPRNGRESAGNIVHDWYNPFLFATWMVANEIFLKNIILLRFHSSSVPFFYFQMPISLMLAVACIIKIFWQS